MKEVIGVVCGILAFIVVVFGIAWGAVELDAHYDERQYLFEWELQQRTIAGLLTAAEQLLEIAKR